MATGRVALAELVRLRPATAADDDFLAELYASTRADELAALPLPPAQKAAFVRQQYDAQDAHYRAAFPHAERSVVVVRDAPVGRFYVDRAAGEVRVVDISLIPEYRGKGIGEALLRRVLADAAAARLPVRLHVLAGNPARRLYVRLGFRPTGWTGPHEAMEARP